MSIRIAIIGDYDPEFAPYQATDAALAHAADALGFDIASTGLPTASLDAPHALEAVASFSGLWVAPGSPYQSMQGALRAIRFARTYDTTAVTEQYYCNFGVNPDCAALLTSGDLAVVRS